MPDFYCPQRLLQGYCNLSDDKGQRNACTGTRAKSTRTFTTGLQFPVQAFL